MTREMLSGGARLAEGMGRRGMGAACTHLFSADGDSAPAFARAFTRLHLVGPGLASHLRHPGGGGAPMRR